MPNYITPEAEKFLQAYLNNPSPTGFESRGQQLWLEYLKPYVDDWKVDNYGTCYGIINPDADYRVVIEGHSDEISWFVSYISDDGMISVVRNGGSDQVIAPSKRVNIHTANGPVRGIFGWPAIHVRRDESEYQTKVENLWIDLGCSTKDEVLALGVHVGCVCTYVDEFEILNGKYYIGRALDNRMGGFCIAQVARVLKEEKIQLPFALYVVNSVQEEIGLRGAEMVAQSIQPHAAIVTDVTHDTTTPMMNKKRLGDVKCGNGPSVTYAPAVHNKLRELILDTATEHSIPVQKEVASRTTGTDTDAFAYSNGGVPSALISLPLRYMHTTVEMAAITDVSNVIALMYHSLQKIQHQHNWKYF